MLSREPTQPSQFSVEATKEVQWRAVVTGIVKEAQLSSWKLVFAAKQLAKEQYHILDLQ